MEESLKRAGLEGISMGPLRPEDLEERKISKAKVEMQKG